jgi:hypothetical protein
MRGQLSLSVGGLRGQSVELFGRSEAFVSGPDQQLFLLDHVHELDPNECVLGCLERFELYRCSGLLSESTQPA